MTIKPLLQQFLFFSSMPMLHLIIQTLSHLYFLIPDLMNP